MVTFVTTNQSRDRIIIVGGNPWAAQFQSIHVHRFGYQVTQSFKLSKTPAVILNWTPFSRQSQYNSRLMNIMFYSMIWLPLYTRMNGAWPWFTTKETKLMDSRSPYDSQLVPGNFRIYFLVVNVRWEGIGLFRIKISLPFSAPFFH